MEVTIPRPHDLIGTSWKRSSARWKGIGCVHPRRRLIGLYRLSATRAPFQLADRDVPINGGDVSTDCTGGTRRCGRPLQDFLPRARAFPSTINRDPFVTRKLVDSYERGGEAEINDTLSGTRSRNNCIVFVLFFLTKEKFFFIRDRKNLKIFDLER